MRLETACVPAFARHETFHPRYGWVKKAHDAAASDADLFNHPEAVVTLGVGKNMVKSIRHWGHAFKVLASVKESGSRSSLATPSALGRTVFADDGWDPYCELPGTLWLLHWLLLAPPSIVPVWWLAFHEFPGVEFTEEQLEQFVSDRARDWTDPHPSAIKKDVSCLLRMYSSGHLARSTFDDVIDCPFRDLGLIRPSSGAPGGFRFNIGPKPTLPPSMAAFACLDFIAREKAGSRTSTISTLATEPGSPGRAFKLTESALLELLERAAAQHEEVDLITSAGVAQLVFAGSPADAATEVLYDHYRGVLGRARFPGALLVAGPTADHPANGQGQLELVGGAQ